MSITNDLAALFSRDLSKLSREIAAFPDDEMLWRTLPGITNPAGNLALHLEGNLREFIGRQLGNLPYTRARELEFSLKGIGRDELAARMAALQRTIPAVVEGLSSERMEAEYPQTVFEKPMSTRHFLIHLYGHLNWHLGQIDYLRRILTGDGAIKPPAV
jgi:uncharacterized damage-inducible protein DinB